MVDVKAGRGSGEVDVVAVYQIDTEGDEDAGHDEGEAHSQAIYQERQHVVEHPLTIVSLARVRS